MRIASLLGGSNPTLERMEQLARSMPPVGYRIVADEAADITLFVENGYVGVPELLRYARRACPAVYVFSEGDWPFPFLPGLYCSLGRARSWATSWSYLLEPGVAPAPADGIAHLFSFVGRTATHPCRARIVALDTPATPCLDASAVGARFARWDYRVDYQRLIARSLFGLCPRGFGASSIRLFEVMRAGRVPVVVSDAWVPTRGIPWEQFSIRVAERDIRHIPDICRERAREAPQMGAAASAAFEAHFAPSVFIDRMLDYCRSQLEHDTSAMGTLWRGARTLSMREVRTLAHGAKAMLTGR